MMILYSKSADVEKAQQMEQQQGRIAQHSITARNKRERNKTETGAKVEQDAEAGRIKEHPDRKHGKRKAAALKTVNRNPLSRRTRSRSSLRRRP